MPTPRILGPGLRREQHYDFDGSIAVAFGDLMFDDADDVKPASLQADQGSEEKNQRLFARRFAGVAASGRLSTDTAADPRFPVLTDIEGEYDCASADWEVGELVGVDEQSGGTALEDRKLVKVTDRSLAIGYCTQREPSATTRVRARLTAGFARVPEPGLLRGSGSNVETLTGNRTLTLADAPVQVLDPGGAGRNVALPGEAASAGLSFLVHNAADAAEVLTIQASNASTTICTPTQNETAIVFCDGTTWRGLVGANN